MIKQQAAAVAVEVAVAVAVAVAAAGTHSNRLGINLYLDSAEIIKKTI